MTKNHSFQPPAEEQAAYRKRQADELRKLATDVEAGKVIGFVLGVGSTCENCAEWHGDLYSYVDSDNAGITIYLVGLADLLAERQRANVHGVVMGRHLQAALEQHAAAAATKQ